jgi:hypothetical protein
MSSRNVAQVRKLVEQYFDPRAKWTPSHDRALRDLLRNDQEARQVYDRAIAAHRLLLGLSPTTPSALEQRRLEAAVAPEPVAKPAWLWPALFGAAAAAAVAVAVVPGAGQRALPEFGPAQSNDRTNGKGPGGDAAEADLGLGITGVKENRGVYEAHSAPLFRDDYVRFSVRCRREGLTHVGIVGLQHGREPVWYMPAATATSLMEVSCSADSPAVDLPEEVRAQAQVEGSVAFVAIYAAQAHPLEDIDQALRAARLPRSFDGPEGEATLARALTKALDLEAPEGVAVRATRIVPGNKK